MSKYVRSPKSRQKILEGKRRQNKFDNTVGAKLHKKHKEMFGVEPKFFSMGNSYEDWNALESIRNAIKTGKPFNQYERLSPEDRMLFEQGAIEID